MSLANDNKIDLVKIIKENFLSIRDKSYEWNDDFYDFMDRVINMERVIKFIGLNKKFEIYIITR